MQILLADDHQLVRAGIRSLVQQMDSAVIAGEVDNGRDAVTFVKANRVDLVLMDVSMKDLNGIEATPQIREASPGTRVLILSMHSTEDFVRRALKAGAAGYLVKDSAPLELQMAIAAVMRGDTYISSRVSSHLVSNIRQPRDTESALDALTARQREILQLVAEGKSTKQIAFALDLSVKTVETHRAAIMDRLDIHDVPGLVVFAIRHKLLSIDPP